MSQNIKSLALVGSLLSCGLVGQVCAAELKVVDKIKVPGAGVESFDISYMDQKTNRFYLADRTNAALDIIDANTGKFIAQIPVTLTVRMPGRVLDAGWMRSGADNQDVTLRQQLRILFDLAEVLNA